MCELSNKSCGTISPHKPQHMFFESKKLNSTARRSWRTFVSTLSLSLTNRLSSRRYKTLIKTYFILMNHTVTIVIFRLLKKRRVLMGVVALSASMSTMSVNKERTSLIGKRALLIGTSHATKLKYSKNLKSKKSEIFFLIKFRKLVFNNNDTNFERN